MKVVLLLCSIMSIHDVVESVKWGGKDESWDTLVCDTFAVNDIKSLHQIGCLRMNVEKFKWGEELFAGKQGFVEVCCDFCLHAGVVF